MYDLSIPGVPARSVAGSQTGASDPVGSHSGGAMIGQHIGKFIEQKRSALGISDEVFMRALGLSSMELYDLEAYEDELMSVFSLAHARAVSSILGMPIADLLETCGWISNGTDSAATPETRSDMIAKAQLRCGLTDDELADAIGFDVVVVTKLKMAPSFIETLPLRTILELATALNLHPRHLLAEQRNSKGAAG